MIEFRGPTTHEILDPDPTRPPFTLVVARDDDGAYRPDVHTSMQLVDAVTLLLAITAKLAEIAGMGPTQLPGGDVAAEMIIHGAKLPAMLVALGDHLEAHSHGW